MMSLNLSDGEEVTVLTDGEDEVKAAEGIETFFAEVKQKASFVQITDVNNSEVFTKTNRI